MKQAKMHFKTDAAKPKKVSRRVDELETKGTLVITQSFRNQITKLCSMESVNEWSGAVFYKLNGGSLRKPEELVCTPLLVFPLDIGTKGYTEYEIDENILDAYIEFPEIAEGVSVGHIHSHNSMATFFSHTDMEELQTNVKTYTLYLSIIVNNKGDICAKGAHIVEKLIKKNISSKYHDLDGKLYSSKAPLIEEETIEVLRVIPFEVQEAYQQDDYVEFTTDRMQKLLDEQNKLKTTSGFPSYGRGSAYPTYPAYGHYGSAGFETRDTDFYAGTSHLNHIPQRQVDSKDALVSFRKGYGLLAYNFLKLCFTKVTADTIETELKYEGSLADAFTVLINRVDKGLTTQKITDFEKQDEIVAYLEEEVTEPIYTFGKELLSAAYDEVKHSLSVGFFTIYQDEAELSALCLEVVKCLNTPSLEKVSETFLSSLILDLLKDHFSQKNSEFAFGIQEDSLGINHYQ